MSVEINEQLILSDVVKESRFFQAILVNNLLTYGGAAEVLMKTIRCFQNTHYAFIVRLLTSGYRGKRVRGIDMSRRFVLSISNDEDIYVYRKF